MDSGDVGVRRRLDTNRTAESNDSGVYSLDSRPPHSPVKQRRPVQLDDVLWCCAFALTMWYFDVPARLLIDPRIDRFYLTLAVIFQLVFLSIGVVVFVLGLEQPIEAVQQRYPKVFPVAVSAFLLACVMFCIATWGAWGAWSIYIVLVSVMFTIVVVSFV